MSAVLVDRLLHGEPTILQMAEDGTILFNEHGTCLISNASSRRHHATLNNVQVWALTDRMPRDTVERFNQHKRFVLVTSSLQDENYKHLKKAYSL